MISRPLTNSLSLILFILINTFSVYPVWPVESTKLKLPDYLLRGFFINGTNVDVVEMDSLLNPTGFVSNEQIINNYGSLGIKNLPFSSQYIGLKATGFFYDAAKGRVSDSQITLHTIEDVSYTDIISINLLGHLKKQRIEFLVNNNVDFQEAKSIAQKEVFAIFGFSTNETNNSNLPKELASENQDAALIAISLILKGDRTLGQFAELISFIASDIKQDGKLSNPMILTELNKLALKLDLHLIRYNLEKRYEYLSINADVPVFEKYVNLFLDYSTPEPLITIHNPEEIKSTSATLSATISTYGLNTEIIWEISSTSCFDKTIYVSTPTRINSPTDSLVYCKIKNLSPGTTYYYRLKSKTTSKITYSDSLALKTKIFSYSLGITMGINYLSFKVNANMNKQNGIKKVYATGALGYHIGFNHVAKLSERFDIAFTPGLLLNGLVFDGRKVNFSFDDYPIIVALNNKVRFIEFPVNIKYHAELNNLLRGYALGGFKYSESLGSSKLQLNPTHNIAHLSNRDIHWEIGGGLDYYLMNMSISLEAKASFGISNLLKDPFPGQIAGKYFYAIESLKSRAFFFSIVLDY